MVIIYEDEENFRIAKMEAGKNYQCRFGKFDFDTIINTKTFGSKVYSKNAKGWALLLKPNTDFYSHAIKNRTQILYTPDISMVLLKLKLRSGMLVGESGTGTGSLSLSLTKAILPSGHLFTFEFN